MKGKEVLPLRRNRHDHPRIVRSEQAAGLDELIGQLQAERFERMAGAIAEAGEVVGIDESCFHAMPSRQIDLRFTAEKTGNA